MRTFLACSGIDGREDAIEKFSELVHQDLANNYWGTTSIDTISMWIQDVNDDSAIHSVADFLPIADAPVPVESRSWGDVKSMFR